MSVEQELIKVSRFKGEDEGDRQEYLEKLRMHVDEISNDKWKGLSDEAKDWLDAAADAMENKNEIPDFEDGEPEEASDPEEPEGDDAAESEAEDGEGGGEDDQAGDAEGDNEDDEVAAEPEPPAKPKPTKKAPAKAPPKAAKKPKPKPTPRDYSGISGAKDSFGVVIGTKAHDAVKMFEKGCTMKDVMEALGSGRFYNLVKRLVGEGHKVEKFEGGVWKITHKDNVKKKGK